MRLLLAAWLLLVAPPSRDEWVARYAESYFPGRSGQIVVIPREGSFVTRPDKDVRFMHGSPWPYDVRVPLILHGQGVRPGTYARAARHVDVAPTLAALLGTAIPGVTGRPLREALRPTTARPRLVLLLVLDGFRADYLQKLADRLPTLRRLSKTGASFPAMRVSYLPSITSVGHATIGTGVPPRLHGIVANSIYDRAAGKSANAFPDLSPRNLMALTVADRWNLANDGRALVHVQTATDNAGGLAGHGACLAGARTTSYATYSRTTGAWTTNADCFRLPEALAAMNSREAWGRGEAWMAHPVPDADEFRRTAWFARWEGDALVATVAAEPFGADDVPDLVMANLKAVDYVGHQYGPESAEMAETLAELDRQVARIVEALDAKVGPGAWALVITADHGMPSEPPPGRARVLGPDLVRRIHERFDPEGRLVGHYAPENAQVHLDLRRLHELKLDVRAVRDFVAAQPGIAAALSEDEIAGR